jgi:acetyl esterase/lipase
MRALALALRATRRPRMATPERARRRIAAPKRETPPPARLTRRHEVSCRTVGGFPCWTVRPQEPSGVAAVYLHGGAYISGISPQHWMLVGRLADAGVRVEVPLYGLAPQHSYREAYPFVGQVWRELAAEAGTGALVLAGDSAGGGLAAGLAQELVAAATRAPDRLVLLAPWLDLTLSHPEMAEYQRRDPWLVRRGLVEAARVWADGDDPTQPRLSPANGPMAGLPPTWVFVGTRDIGHPDAVAFARSASAAGVPVQLTAVEGAVHVYPLVPAPEGIEGRRAVVAAVAGT